MQGWNGKFQSKQWKFEKVRDIWKKGVIDETKFSTLPQADATSLLIQGCQTLFLWRTSHIQWRLTREVDILYSKWIFPLLSLLLADLSYTWRVLLEAGEVGTMLVTQHPTHRAQAEKPRFLGAALGVCMCPLSETHCYAHPALHTYSRLAQSQGPGHRHSQHFRLIKLQTSSHL